jgi:hypothetical protein
MTTEQLFMLADYISDKYISGENDDLNELIAEVAEEEQLNIKQIEALLNEVNRAVFQKLFDIYEDKTFEFPIAKLDLILAKLNRTEPDKVEIFKIEAEPKEVNEEEESMAKAASLIESEINEEDYIIDSSIIDTADIFGVNSLEKEASQPDNTKTILKKYVKLANEFEQLAQIAHIKIAEINELLAQASQIIAELKALGVNENEFVKTLKSNQVPDEVIKELTIEFRKVQPAKEIRLAKTATLKDAYDLGHRIIEALRTGDSYRMQFIKKEASEYDLNSLEEKLKIIGIYDQLPSSFWHSFKQPINGQEKLAEEEIKFESNIFQIITVANKLHECEKAVGQFLKKASEIKQFVDELNDESLRSNAGILFKKHANVIKKYNQVKEAKI